MVLRHMRYNRRNKLGIQRNVAIFTAAVAFGVFYLCGLADDLSSLGEVDVTAFTSS